MIPTLANITFSTDISLGNIISVITVLGGLYTFHITNIRRIQGFQFKVNMMWNVFKQRFNISDEEEQEIADRMKQPW